jgi:hypothetical protein
MFARIAGAVAATIQRYPRNGANQPAHLNQDGACVVSGSDHWNGANRLYSSAEAPQLRDEQQQFDRYHKFDDAISRSAQSVSRNVVWDRYNPPVR